MSLILFGLEYITVVWEMLKSAKVLERVAFTIDLTARHVVFTVFHINEEPAGAGWYILWEIDTCSKG